MKQVHNHRLFSFRRSTLPPGVLRFEPRGRQVVHGNPSCRLWRAVR